MKSVAIWSAIVLSIPQTREFHGSSSVDKCSNSKCEMNGGAEKHKLTMEEFLRKVRSRYTEIVRE